MSVAELRQNANDDIQIDGERPALIDPGVYDLAFQFHKTGYLFGRAPKVMCYFKIITQGPCFGVSLCRYYNVKTLTSKPRKGGAFKIGWKGDFIREYALLFGLPQRIDRISTEAFRRAIVRGKVTTVATDSKKRSIPDALRYSVISELLEVVQ